MGFRMKTTLNIDDTVMAELKREAARQGRTMSELVETALRLLLTSQRKRGRIPALPKFRSSGALVDVADRDALYAGERALTRYTLCVRAQTRRHATIRFQGPPV